MTRIESAIYAILASDDGGETTLSQIAALYQRGHNASHDIYSRIQWDLLDEQIKAKRGQEGLDYVKREALVQQ
jgi:hypothetical protein